MRNFIEWAKEHKGAAIGIVAALVAFIYVIRSAGTSSGSGSTQLVQTGPSDAVQAAAIQAGAAASIAQAQSVQQAQQLQAQYNIAVRNGDLQAQQDLLTAQVVTHQIDAQAAGVAQGVQAQVDLATIAAQSQMYVTDSNNKVLTTQLLSQSGDFRAALTNEAAIRANDNSTTVAINKLASDTQLGLSAINGGVATHLSDNAAAVTIQTDNNRTGIITLGISTQAAIDKAKIDAALALGTTQSNNDRATNSQAIQAYSDLTYAQLVGDHETADYLLSIQQQGQDQYYQLAGAGKAPYQVQAGVQNNAINKSFWSSVIKTGATAAAGVLGV